MSLEMSSRFELPEGSITRAPEQTIICTTNCVGAMGRGVALSFKQDFPHVYREYRKRWRDGLLKPNYLFTIPLNENQQVLMFPTKDQWWKASPDGLVEQNLAILSEYWEEFGIISMALPPLGLANGWVKKRGRVTNAIIDTCNALPFRCVLYY